MKGSFYFVGEKISLQINQPTNQFFGLHQSDVRQRQVPQTESREESQKEFFLHEFPPHLTLYLLVQKAVQMKTLMEISERQTMSSKVPIILNLRAPQCSRIPSFFSLYLSLSFDSFPRSNISSPLIHVCISCLLFGCHVLTIATLDNDLAKLTDVMVPGQNGSISLHASSYTTGRWLLGPWCLL